jgi:hypothetical protein
MEIYRYELGRRAGETKNYLPKVYVHILPAAGSMQTRGVHYAAAAVVPSSLAGRKPR